MRLFPPELEVGEYEGFAPDKDIFSRKQFGEGLGNLFANVDDPMVAVLDAPWGSGKSTFIKMWCGHMRNRGFPVIYFDAFKNDYTDDAFLALAGEVIALADDLGPIDGEARKGFLLKAKQVAWAATKGGFKKGLSKLFGEDGVEEIGAAIAEESANCLLDFGDAYLQEKLEGRKKERDAFRAFGDALQVISSELSKAMRTKTPPTKNNESTQRETEGISQRPLIFVIDELDRCKPPFALDLLEKAKHFFSVPHIHFLLVTHMEQLENSVRFAYGMEGQAGTYLQKFYHVVLGLPDKKDDYAPTNTEKYLDKLFIDLPGDGENGQYTDGLHRILTNFSNKSSMTFRSLERISTMVGILLASTRKSELRLNAIAGPLCIMKTVAPDLYRKAKAKTLTLDEVYSFMAFDESTSLGLWCMKYWGFCLGDDKYYEENKNEMNRVRDAFGYSLHERGDILPGICARIDILNFQIR